MQYNTSSVHIAKDGITWNIVGAFRRGRFSKQNVLRITNWATSNAERFITDGSMFSSCRLFINETMLKHIKQCTEEEAHRKFRNNEWFMSLYELDAFIALLHAKWTNESKNIEIETSWNNLFLIHVYLETISRNRFREIMKYVRFHMKSNI